MAVFVGVDIGGTFTDLVGFDARKNKLLFSKTLTTYPNLVSGVVTCLEAAAIDTASIDIFKHGTTLVINTLLERRGAKTALIKASRNSGVALTRTSPPRHARHGWTGRRCRRRP